jgi:hypothetical protein
MDMTIDKRHRTSDGTDMCAVCGNIIEQGELFITETANHNGLLAQRDMCRGCIVRGERSDALSWVVVIAVSLAVVAGLCLGMAG